MPSFGPAYKIYASSAFVVRYARQIGAIDDPAFYERRATLDLLPPVAGKQVLDAGCGPGIYSRWLSQQGAEVCGLDYSPAMLTELHLRAPQLRLMCADLAAPLPLASASFDVILCAMVLQHLRDWAPVLSEFRRLLAPGGCIVLSTTHPLTDLPPAADYFAITETSEEWEGYGLEMPCYRRSFGQIWRDVASAGLRIETLVEPQAPGDDPFVTRQPWALCLRLVPAALP